MYTTVIYIIFERGISFLIILKWCEFSGFQTKFFKYLKNEKINLSKVILKLECLFYQNMYLLFHHIFYSQSHFDSKKSKKRSNRKKNTPYRRSCKCAIVANAQHFSFELNYSYWLIFSQIICIHIYRFFHPIFR